MAATQNILFTPYTSIPASLDTSTAVYFSALSGSAVWVNLKVTAGTGNCTCIIWDPTMQEWMPFPNEMPVDAAKNDGKAVGRWMKDLETAQYLQLVVPGGITVQKASMYGMILDR